MRQTGIEEEGSESEGGEEREGGRERERGGGERERAREREAYGIKKGGGGRNKVERMSNTPLHKAITLSRMHNQIHHTYTLHYRVTYTKSIHTHRQDDKPATIRTKTAATRAQTPLRNPVHKLTLSVRGTDTDI